MKTLKEINSILEKHKKEITDNYKVKEIGIFGSYVRNEQQKKSDLDVLVSFKQPIDFFTFLELEEYISGLIGRKVDLVMKKALKPNIGRYILKEVIYV